MDREWMKDIRQCDGCRTEQYALPRYVRGTGLFLGFFCDPCEAIREADAREWARERE
jgi:hypothetical protein